MRTVTEIFEVYDFTELSDKAKEKVREFYGECQEPCFFTEDCEEYIKEILPNSEVGVSYSLGYSQSDYFSLTGIVSLSDVLDKISDSYTDKEIKYLHWLINEWCSSITLDNRWCYGNRYFTRSSIDFAADVISDMEYSDIRGIRHELIEDFEESVYSFLDDLRNELKNDGYAYFYEYTDEDIEEWCDCNEYEFLANGELYA